MTSDMYNRLTEILRDVFDNDDVVATPELTAEGVDGWDSLGNIRLFLTIEKEFRVQFSTAEMSSLKCVGELVDAISRKLSEK